jgi:hypothetical protein
MEVKKLKIIKNVRLKKSSKFLILLLASILVGTANAAIFYSLTMQPQVTVSTPVIKFSEAPDHPGGTVTDAWCLLTAKSYPNATLTYEKAVYLNNTDSVNSHSFMLRYVSITPTNGTADVGNWTSIKFLVYNSSGYVFSLNFTVLSNNWTLAPSSGQTNYYSIPKSTGWWIRLETLSPATAIEGKVCNIQIAVDVQQ